MVDWNYQRSRFPKHIWLPDAGDMPDSGASFGLILLAVIIITCVYFHFKHNSAEYLIQNYQAQNTVCRGGDPRMVATYRACEERTIWVQKLLDKGYCYGKPGQAEYQKTWHDCDEDR